MNSIGDGACSECGEIKDDEIYYRLCHKDYLEFHQMKAERAEYQTVLRAAEHALQSYKYGNSAVDLADEIITRIKKLEISA